MAIEKYRVHEVAKDFGLSTKTITEILTKYATAPKNHMQVLDDHELSIIFDYLTQHNQVSGIQVIFADTYQEKKEGGTSRSPAGSPVPGSAQASGPEGGTQATVSARPAKGRRGSQAAACLHAAARLPGSPEENCGHPQRR